MRDYLDKDSQKSASRVNSVVLKTLLMENSSWSEVNTGIIEKPIYNLSSHVKKVDFK